MSTLLRNVGVRLAIGALLLTASPVLAADFTDDEMTYLSATMPLVQRDHDSLNDLSSLTLAIGDGSVPYSLGVSQIPPICNRLRQVKLDFDPVQAPLRFARLDSLVASGFKTMITSCDTVADGGRTYDVTKLNQGVVLMKTGDGYFQQANLELLSLGAS